MVSLDQTSLNYLNNTIAFVDIISVFEVFQRLYSNPRLFSYKLFLCLALQNSIVSWNKIKDNNLSIYLFLWTSTFFIHFTKSSILVIKVCHTLLDLLLFPEYYTNNIFSNKYILKNSFISRRLILILTDAKYEEGQPNTAAGGGAA
jgi:hypothetical protein